MRKSSPKSTRLAAIAAAFGISALLFSVHTVVSGEDKKPEIQPWGVDLTARNTDIKPGDDFYHYAGGKWLDSFEIPADLPSYGSFTVLTLRGEDQIKAIIEEQPKAKSTIETNGEKIAELYSGFMDQDKLNAQGLAPLDPYLKKVSATKSLDDIAALMGELGRVNGGGISPFNFFIDQDEKVPSQYIPHFIQGGLGPPNRDYYLKGRSALCRRATGLPRLSGQTVHDGEEDNPGARADSISALESALRRVTGRSSRRATWTRPYNKIGRADLRSLRPISRGAVPGRRGDEVAEGVHCPDAERVHRDGDGVQEQAGRRVAGLSDGAPPAQQLRLSHQGPR
jgi:predicted metalloendopeptidase